MSRSVNRVILVGNAGADPDVRETPSGSTVAHLSLATNRTYQQNGQEQKKTEWHRLTFWAGAARTIEKWVRKGTRMYVEGRIEYGSYDRDGVTIPTTDVVVQEFVFLDRKPNGESSEVGVDYEESDLLD
ncbi:MAG: single-stranded DNA-binding protein [marine benthic group bacterium]|jgi:single-strand DNA-binding protein|nr:single-stranded DNA-binding protein [Candidatus Benthicola marisminoris]